MSATPPFVIAHRGASAEAPENTLAAIELAAAQGARWIEIDTTTSADRQAVLHHDDSLERCTDGRGLLLAQPLAALRALDAGAWFAPRYTGERIATLAEAGAACARLGLGCNVEIKVVDGWEAPTAEVVCAAIAGDWPRAAPILISSFSTAALQVARRVLPAIARAHLSTVIPADWERALAATDCGALHCADTALVGAESVAALAARGVPLRVYTVDDPARAATLRRWGVAAVFSNRPGHLLAALGGE